MNFPTILNPASSEAADLFQLTVGVSVLCGLILLFVIVLIAIICLRFKGKANSPEPKPIYGNTKLEILWTAVPLLILSVVLFFTIKTMVSISPSEEEKPDLIVIGHQWWWEVRYLAGNKEIITANEVHIPVGKKLLLELRAADVVHDFWVPELGRKIDAVPGHPNQMWLRADHERNFQGFCSEFCGASHAWMKILVVAESETKFAQWLDHIQSPAGIPLSESSKRGLELFRTNTCVSCHQVAGLSEAIQIGPDLTHVGSRQTLAAGALKNNRNDLERWLHNPGAIKPGAHMPNFGFTTEQIYDLSSFLGDLK